MNENVWKNIQERCFSLNEWTTTVFVEQPLAKPVGLQLVLGEYQATLENLPELNGGKPAKTKAKKEIYFSNLGLILSYLR